MRRMGINEVLTLAVIASLFIGIASLIGYATTSTYKISTALEEKSLLQSAKSMAGTLELYIDNAADQAENLATLPAVIEALQGKSERAQNMLNIYIANSETLFSAVVIGPDGAPAAATLKNGSPPEKSYADREYFKAILGGRKSFVSKTILQDKSAGILMFVAAHAVVGPDGKTLGMVIVCPLWDSFTKKFLDPLRFGESGYGFMLDGEGNIIAHAMDKSLLLKQLPDRSIAQYALDLKNGVMNYEYKGQRKYMAVAEVPQTGWLVCMSAVEAEMAALAAGQRNVLIIVGLVVLVCVAAIIILFNRVVVLSPLTAISRFTERVAAGDLTARLSGRFRFELAGLAHNLEGMVAELKTKLGFAEGVMNGIPTPCGIVGPDHNVVWVNKQICDLLEKHAAPETYKGQRSGQFYANDASRETGSDQALRERRVISAQNEFVTPSGNKLHVNVVTTPFYDMDNNLLGSISFWLDQTEAHTQQQRIAAQNALMADTAAKATTTSERMASAAEQLSAQIDQANQGSQEQNNRVQDTVAAVEEMNATILEVAKNAGDTAQNAEAARAKAREGAQLVVQVVNAVGSVRDAATRVKGNMHALGDKAQGIGAVLNVISDIADQTNLLALNAAIEAARAGEAGRGFAVVADEVRKLAEKTMHATKEVGDAISGIQRGTAETVAMFDQAAVAVEQATSLAEKSGSALTEIVAVVEAAGDQVRAIATAAEQQSATSEEINRSIESISRIASETASAMQESTQAVADLATQAHDLRMLVADIQGGDKAALPA